MRECQRSHYVRASDFEYIHIFVFYPPTVHQAEDARARTFLYDIHIDNASRKGK